MVSWEDFEKIDLRTGTVLEAYAVTHTKKPAVRMTIDFGPLGIKKSSAQLTELYQAEALTGCQIIAVVNFPPKQIGDFISECLILGVYDEQGVVILTPERPVENGSKVG